MSNFYGGKQGFSFFIAKTYILVKTYNDNGEICYQEKQNNDSSLSDNTEYSSIDSFLSNKFSTDTDVHYNDYILISIGIDGFNFNSSNPYHGNLYRKDITNFKLIGNLAGPPGGVSQVIPVEWSQFEQEYLNDKQSYTDTISPQEEGKTQIAANVVSGRTNKEILFKYYTYEKGNGVTILKLAIQIPAPYFDFKEYYPEKTGSAPLVKPLFLNEEGEDTRTNPFYNNYEYPLVTKYYKPRIEKDELYGDLYEYTKNLDNEMYSYQASGEEIYLGKIKQESGILIGQNISYYILQSDASNQTDSDLQQYLEDKTKRDTLLTAPQDNYILLTNKKVICKKLNDDFPCGLGYKYSKLLDSTENDKTKREIDNIDLVGKIITYGDENGPIVNEKITTWFFGYDFSREAASTEIIPNWYYLSLYASETKIIFAEDQNVNGEILPLTNEDIKPGDLWIGLVDSSWKGSL